MTRNEKNMEYTLATQAIEKLIPSQKAVDLCRQMDTGKISADTAVSILLQHYTLDQVLPMRETGLISVFDTATETGNR